MTARGKAKAPVPLAQPETAKFITYKIGQLAKLFDRSLMPFLSERYDLSLAEWRALTFLYTSGPGTVRELANRLRVDRAEVSRACAELVRHFHVKRSVDPYDARSAVFEITASGRTLHNRILPLREAVQDELIGTLTRHEHQVLLRALDKLMDYMLDAGRQAPTKRASPRRPKGEKR
ncbi:MAG TPA: MarR family winged helix-turn-helix transcriptional regulator [Stellaceae bacterium]|jgi:DNA-binding MarR family transcriptional regulator|nr:MarR family winged helix-turn-helix transcriptional regulator [Stellaceae bacterium]